MVRHVPGVLECGTVEAQHSFPLFAAVPAWITFTGLNHWAQNERLNSYLKQETVFGEMARELYVHCSLCTVCLACKAFPYLALFALPVVLLPRRAFDEERQPAHVAAGPWHAPVSSQCPWKGP